MVITAEVCKLLKPVYMNNAFNDALIHFEIFEFPSKTKKKTTSFVIQN